MNKYLLEIGVEEFPAKHIKSTQNQILAGFDKLLKENKYSYENMTMNSTPRRFALIVEGIDASAQESSEKVKGPAKKIALDQDGNPSKALQGFLKSKNVGIEDIFYEDLNGTEYVFVNIKHKLESLEDLLKRGVPDIIRNVTNPRAMRWGGKNLRFLRPIRWIVSLLDDELLEFDLEAIKVSRMTKGHRTLGSGQIEIDKIDNYERLLEENFVIVDEEKRRNIIYKGLNKLSKEKGGNYIHDEDLLDEVVNINEYPTPFIANFDSEYLKLPKEVIVTPMKDHQRYFPIEDEQGDLIPYFISVRNGDKQHIDNVAKGNEKVLVARLEDAKFFYELDMESSIEDYLEKLSGVGYHDGLGNMAQKTKRLESLVETLGDQLNISSDVIDYAKRAAHLSKADLVSKTVIEFTELQGVMGRIYSEKAGENKIVAQAIEEQYMPRFAGDKLPESTAGILLSLADKIDSIAGLNSLGIEVTGSQDPYGQRRSALGILNILIDNKMSLDLRKSIQDSLYNYVEDFGQNFNYDEVTDKIIKFIIQRLRNKMIDEGFRYDIVDSVLANAYVDVFDMQEKISSLSKLFERDDVDELVTRFVRMKNISKDAESLEIDEDIIETKDRAVMKYLSILEEAEKNSKSYLDYLKSLAEVSLEVDKYLDNTMINVDDERLKASRLALVKNFSNKVEEFFDPNQIVRG